MLPSAFTTAVPFLGPVAIVTLDGFNIPPKLPATSLLNTFTVTGVPLLVVAWSLLATGLSVAATGSNTVITNGTTGQPVV